MILILYPEKYFNIENNNLKNILSKGENTNVCVYRCIAYLTMHACKL